jgi:glycogen operon protein
MSARTWPGTSYPLGATADGAGVNFAIFSEAASKVELCLFDGPADARERERIELSERTAHVFHGYVPGLWPGQLYGYRVHGPYDPRAGLRFNPAKLLVDPYAYAVSGEPSPRAPIFGFDRAADPDDDTRICTRDSAAGMPKCVVVDHAFDWGDDRAPRTPWQDTILYEVHVKGFTRRHPGVPEALRGTYAGLASEAAIDHLRRLGVTAVELLPVHEMANEPALEARGLVNYWGYNTVSYFAPAGRYASSGRLGEQIVEFKRMVKALHAAGIEVILDVVYNHTAEGDRVGPTLSMKGIDNRAYYRLVQGDPRRYKDLTGCGNTLDLRHPQVLGLVMDSLRYWATEMRVDGFRFDLASALARSPHEVDPRSPFLQAIHQDPVLARVKLIAEPWDVGERGYQVGNFPIRWAEWNGRYRDSVRRFWKGDESLAAEIGYRLTGSSDLYEAGGRRPQASVNFITAHDGFTLRDLVSYSRKHNEANGEGNRDGSDHNDSSNHGVEGETDNPDVARLRERQQRNLLATLLLSQGVPMLSGGDEIGRTQRGNNNAYCQDNELSWHDWDLDDRRRDLLDFVSRLVALRRAQPVLRRCHFFSGGYVHESGQKDILWFRPDGEEMTPYDWAHPHARSIGMLLGGGAIPCRDARGERVAGDTLLLLLNAGPEPVEFALPSVDGAARERGAPTDVDQGERWEVLIDTRAAAPPPEAGARRYGLIARSMAVMRLVSEKKKRAYP